MLGALMALVPYMASAQGAPDYVAHPDYAVRQWTVRDGLPNNTINDLLLASDGYLWLATNEGLVRFDGAHFTVFNSTNTPQLPSNRFNSLAEEPAGYLWIISEQGGLVLYRKGQFTGFNEKATTNGQRLRPPVSADGVADTVLIGMEAGIVRYTAGRLEPYRRDVIAAEVTVMERDVDGRLWVYALGSGIHCFEADGTVRQIPLPDSLRDSWYVRLLADQAGRMWAQERSHIFRIDGDQFERMLDGASLEYADTEGGIWGNSVAEGWWHYDSSGVSTLYPKSDRMVAESILEGPDGQRW
ncbi:MAG TPA: two-component regulator propeller domain-containing protein, partial [Rhodothermales bacterium]|nr:two-component regulator propeller domain-containing protein [Rhodothermales bacterium]